MKRQMTLSALGALCLTLTGCSGQATGCTALVIIGILVLLFAILRTYSSIQYSRSRRTKKRRKKEPMESVLLTAILYAAALVLLLGAMLLGRQTPADVPETTTQPTTETTPTQTEPPSLFKPAMTPTTDPSRWGITWEIFDNGTKVANYNRQEPVFFGEPEEYFALPGISAFRGNNYRNSPTYGTANVQEETLALDWSVKTGTLAGGHWSGSGWTGQPLIVKWDDETKSIMNMYPEKQRKADLVEVIYATLDGHIYFLDIDDGSYTRDPIDVGMCFKGAGSLDPRGYPLMYVGSGDATTNGKRPRMFIISLINGKILYEYGHEETISLRKDNNNWCAFDSSPLVHAQTDTLIWPGESGVLYTMKLNTQYDRTAGTISINPGNMVTTRYNTDRSTAGSYWLGYEASANIVGSYLYISENGGMFYCIDLNTMTLVWAQDTKDDSNSTPVFEYISDEEAYVYTAPSLHWTKDMNNQGSISIYKLDALTGQIVWEKPYDVHTVSGVSGGIQSTPLLGKPGTSLEGLIIYTISRTPEQYSGILVALDVKTGSEVWRMSMTNYAWSSPVAVYEDDGTGYIVVCDSMGYCFLINSRGQQCNLLNLGGLVEASPAVYEDMIIVGTRKEKICGIKIN